MNTSLPLLPRLTAVVLLLLASFSFARAADEPRSRADEVVALPEFTVADRDDGSYMPTESTTGSRVNAKVKDLPYAVSMLTSEFLRDFSIFEATEELSYMSSVTGVDDGGNLNLRGFNGGTNNLRNGLASNGLIDSSSLDRIEVIKGPAAAIYGQTAPSGAMVVSTKRPTSTPHAGVSMTAGSYSLNQVTINTSGPLRFGDGKPKFFYRVDSQYYHRLYEIPGISSMTRSVTGTVTYRPDGNTSVTVDAGYLLRLNNSAGGVPYLFDNVTKRYTGGYAFSTAKKIIANPSDQKPRWNAVAEAIVEHRFNAIFSGKFATSVNHRPLVNYQSFGGSQYDPALNRIIDGRTSISYAKDDFDYRNAALDLAAKYPLKGSHQRTLLTVDYSFQNRRGFSTTSTAAFNTAHPGLSTAQKQVDTAFSIIPYEPVSIAAKGGPSYNALSYVRDNYVAAAGAFLRHEATLLNDHLIFTAGYRHDYIRADLREPVNRTQRKLHDLNDSMLLGVTYRITPGISWYVSRNESFSPLAITTSANPTAAIPQTTSGVGYEIGVKGELLEGRLGFTADVYDTRRKNEQVTEIDVATGVTSVSYIGNTKTRGFEFDGNYRLTNRVQALMSYSYTDARAVNQGRDTDAEGRHTKGSPLNSFSSALRQQVNPALSLTLGMRYVGKSPAFNPTDGGTFSSTTGRFVSQNGSRDVFVPSATIWTAGATYRWKSQRYTHLNHSLTLTAKNLFDKLYIVPGNNRSIGDRFGFYATYSINH